MNTESPAKNFFAILIPTPVQASLAFLVSLFTALAFQREALLQHFTGGASLVPAETKQLNLQVLHFLGLSLVGQAVIIIFWAIVGLGAYLIVWFVHNGIINARNKVIIRTQYTNQTKTGIQPISLILKAAALIAAITAIATLPIGLNAWLGLWQKLLSEQFGWIGVLLATASIFGFAAEIYLSFMLFQVMIDRFRR